MNELLARWIEPAGGEWGHGERLSRSLPCGKNPGKKFPGLPCAEKSRAIIDLGHDDGKNRRRGREPAGKPEKSSDRRLAPPIIA